MQTRAKRRKVAQRGAGGGSKSSAAVVEEEVEKGVSPGREGRNEKREAKNEPKKKKQKRWFAAVAHGDEAEVAKLLATDPTLLIEEVKSNNLDTCHPSALHIAAFHGFDKIVALLLQAAKENKKKQKKKKSTLRSPLVDDDDDDDSCSSSFLVDDHTGWTVLHVAAGQGHDQVVKLLLPMLLAAKRGNASSSSPSSSSSSSSMVDATDFDGCTALHHAARSGSCRVVELLLAASPALLDAVDNDGCTALLYAVKRQHKEIVDHLLALNPKNLDAGSDAVDGFTRAATDASDADGGTSSSSPNNGRNVLHHAINQNNKALMWRLLEMRPDLIYKPSRNGFTPLSMAMSGNFGMKLFALYHPQAVAAVTDIDKVRLLREAVRARDEDNDEFGLDLMLPISTLDQVQAAFVVEGKTPCTARLRALVEVQCGPLSLVLNQDVMGIVNEYLFGGGGGSKSVGEPESAGESEFSEVRKGRRREARWFEATVQDDDKLMAQLLDEDPTLIDAVNGGEGDGGEETASFSGYGSRGSTALHMASSEGCDRVVALLLAVKPSLVAVGNDEGDTALHLATICRNVEIVKLLLAASPSSFLIANFVGTTPLMHAALNNDLEMVELLLTACPDALDLVDQCQYTALLYAAYRHHFKITSLLVAAKPRNIRAAQSTDRNVLHYEVSCASRYHGHAETVEKILAIDPGLVRTLTTSRQTPLWLAVDHGCDNELIENLFHRFPHAVHMADESGRTPYDIAVEHNNDFAVNLFS